MRVRVTVLVVTLSVLTARAETLLDQMNMIRFQTYDVANGNAIGGDLHFGRPYALQIADDFTTTSTGYIVTELEVGNEAWAARGFTDARISIFANENNRPSEDPVFSRRASELGGVIANRWFDSNSGLPGYRTTISGLSIPLEPNKPYFISIQVYSGPDNWAGTCRESPFTGADSFLRDWPLDEGEGGYGWTEWRAAGDTEYGAGDSAYRVEAVPEPGALGLFAAAISVLRRR